MSLKILPGTEPVTIDTVVMMIYGDPGAGKTSLAFTASAPLLLDFDQGAYRSGFRKDSVPLRQWAEVAGMDAKDLEGYDTIVVDTVGRALDALAADIIADNPKMGRRDGALTQQGYGALKGRFAQWVATLRQYGKDLVLIAHGKESRNGDDLILRPDITGGSYAEVFKIADGVGYLHMVEKRRTLEFDPSERFIGKNPANLSPVEVPNFTQQPEFLGGLIASTKEAMGNLSNDAKAAVAEVDEWREVITGIKTAKAMNETLGLVNDIEAPGIRAQVKALMRDRCAETGIVFDKDKGQFVKAKQDSEDAAA